MRWELSAPICIAVPITPGTTVGNVFVAAAIASGISLRGGQLPCWTGIKWSVVYVVRLSKEYLANNKYPEHHISRANQRRSAQGTTRRIYIPCLESLFSRLRIKRKECQGEEPQEEEESGIPRHGAPQLSASFVCWYKIVIAPFVWVMRTLLGISFRAFLSTLKPEQITGQLQFI